MHLADFLRAAVVLGGKRVQETTEVIVPPKPGGQFRLKSGGPPTRPFRDVMPWMPRGGLLRHRKGKQDLGDLWVV